ncbi:hypothetical protein CAP39_07510 [Sphingomonas sp. IBVSS1]|nr:hypothetical protein CAP39_07510 [Sphingomonas sp. IBVSS1]
MRTNATPAERRLWTILCNSRLAGLKFRRQSVIGPYIVDFLCPALALVIEVDGDSHDDADRDAIRDARLNDMGFTVMRFANRQVLDQLDMVGLSIIEVASGLQARWPNGPHNRLGATPTPNPSPEGEGS